jgi:enamine deaminase RidA (YjgF/YER057c/UK114 family)
LAAFPNYAIDAGINRKLNSMKRHLISSGSTFETEIGYSRAVVQGDWIFVSGTTGFAYDTMTISEQIEEQAEQCFKNINAALAKADAEITDVVRVLYIVPQADEFKKCWPVLRKYFGESKPAATMISAGLADVRMKIEIEVTALKQNKKA